MEPQPPVVAFAPGRVNLIGDHTDYNGGLALPVAIASGTTAAFRGDRSPALTVVSSALPDPVTVSLDGTSEVRGPGALTGALVNQVWAVLGRGARGGSARVTTTLPLGAGLSSSASFCVALAMVLGWDPDPVRMARLCQRAERTAGSDVGLMDPLVVTAARAGHALLIDFAQLNYEHVSVPGGADLTAIHSGVGRALGTTGYAQRRRECGVATRQLGAPLGSLDPADLRGLSDPILIRRARHVVSECGRVRAFVAAMGSGDLATAGQLMDESHRSLSADFEVSVGPVDDLVRLLRSRPGVYGVRMTGGGFGGCVVALSERGAVDPAAWEGRAWPVSPAPGARLDPVSTA